MSAGDHRPGGRLPAPRPEQVHQVPPARVISPGSPNVFRGRLVVIYGTGAGTGLFVYSGTPALGNPPIFAISTAATDPYGNVITPDAISDRAMPFLTYSGAPAAGNLATSFCPAAGTDAFGNAFLAGFTSYQNTGSGYVAINLSASSQLAWFTAATYAGPYTQVGQFASDVNGDLTLTCNDRFLINNPLYLPAGTPSVFAGMAALFASPDGNLAFVSGGDTNTYSTGRLSLSTAGTQTISSTSGVPVTGLTATCTPGTYRVSGLIAYAENAAAGSPGFYFTAPTVTSALISSIVTQRGIASSTVQTGTVTGFGSGNSWSGPVMSNGNKIMRIDGIFTATGANGGFALNALTSAGADTYTIQPQSFLDLMPAG